jgi:arsenical pump membrane protein
VVARWTLALGATGIIVAVVAAVLAPKASRAAASQTWPAFVLVAGLLLVGLVAAEDKLFAAAGARLADSCPGGLGLFAGLAVLVVSVTAVLNLDTSVAFLTPVAVHTARRRGEAGALLVPACLLLSNAGSLLLPGSNLTNLIVLGNLHLSGGTYFERMAGPWVAAALVTAAVLVASGRRDIRRRVEGTEPGDKAVIGLGVAAVLAVVVLVLALSSPAPWVAGLGMAAVAVRLAGRRLRPADVLGTVDLPVLLGLFGLAVGLGALGREWSGPTQLMGHLGPWATAAVGGAAAVSVNNLPAAALLSARAPTHPLSLLIGLDLGPNLFVSGSLAWVLWVGAARAAGGQADVGRTVRIGLIAAPASVAAAEGALLLVGHLT